MEQNNIYPNLNEDNGSSFRLQQICIIKDNISKNLEHHERVRKKYAKSRSVFNKIAIGSGSISVVLSGSALGTGLTGLGISLAIPLGVLSGFSAIVSSVCASMSKKLSKNVQKHSDIVMLSKTKLNTINDIVSKSLNDNQISDQEFYLIVNEMDKYNQMRQSIRNKRYRKNKLENNDVRLEEKKKQRMREEIMVEMKKKLDKTLV